MPWYQGPSLLYDLENVYIGSDRNLIDARFPVQWIIRPQSDEHHDLRGYAGQVAGGVFRVGDEVVVLPSGHRSTITRISTHDGELDTAAPPMSVVIELADEIDISRGSMLSRPHNQPTVASELDATICWMADAPLRPGGRYLLKHTTQTVLTLVDELRYAIDVNTLHREKAAELGLNQIGRVRLRTQKPLMLDEYRDSRTTGGFILIDEATSDTVGAGMVVRAGPEQHIEVLEAIA
jgi:bifunctional enzyme CysN/CysC